MQIHINRRKGQGSCNQTAPGRFHQIHKYTVTNTNTVMQNTNALGEEEVLAPGGFHQPLLLKKLGNTCLLEQEQNDNNVTKYVLSREDLRRFIGNAMIICLTPRGGRSSFSHQRAPSSTFLYETTRMLIGGSNVIIN